MLENIKCTKVYEMLLPLYERLEVFLWQRRNKYPPTPHVIKQGLLVKYARKHKLKIFIETGTYLGNMTSALSGVFENIFTIELDTKLYLRVRSKFVGYKNIKVLKGDSSQVLKKIVPTLDKPSLFWLDAHYSGGITFKGKDNSPICGELETIFNSKIKGHIILIDDAHLFVGKSGYPTRKELKKIISEKAPKSELKIHRNIFIIE